jgi:hypothetical protein
MLCLSPQVNPVIEIRRCGCPHHTFGSRPRWGDYGAAVTDGSSIWIASEYVNQTCTFNTWLGTNFRCGNTRTQLANWGTRITKIVP